MSMHDHLTVIRAAMADDALHPPANRRGLLKLRKPTLIRFVRFNALVAAAITVSVTAAYFAGCMSA